MVTKNLEEETTFKFGNLQDPKLKKLVNNSNKHVDLKLVESLVDLLEENWKSRIRERID